MTLPRPCQLLECAFAALLVANSSQSTAQDQVNSKPLIELTYRAPTDSEVQNFRDFLHGVDIEQSIPDRFAYRCEGRLFPRGMPEQFVSIHAFDRDLDAVRHIVRRTFTDDDDPILLFSIEDREGFSDSKTSNARFFPKRHDRLRIADQVYFSDDPAASIHRDKVKLTGEDRNFDPVTATLLPMSDLFRGPVSKMRVSQLFGIDKLVPEQVSVVGTSFVVKDPVMTASGPTGSYEFIKFVDGIPVVFEVWRMLKKGNQLQYRTVSRWKEFGEVRLPTHIEALQIWGSKTFVFEANLEWRFNEQLPARLFEVSNVTTPGACDW